MILHYFISALITPQFAFFWAISLMYSLGKCGSLNHYRRLTLEDYAPLYAPWFFGLNYLNIFKGIVPELYFSLGMVNNRCLTLEIIAIILVFTQALNFSFVFDSSPPPLLINIFSLLHRILISELERKLRGHAVQLSCKIWIPFTRSLINIQTVFLIPGMTGNFLRPFNSSFLIFYLHPPPFYFLVFQLLTWFWSLSCLDVSK